MWRLWRCTVAGTVLGVVAAVALAGSALAVDTPDLTATALDDGVIKVAWKYKGKTKRKTTVVDIERGSDGSTFAPLVSVQKARRRHFVKDEPSTPGRWWYRARVRNDVETTAWSKPASVDVEGPDAPPGPAGDPPLPAGQSECPAGTVQAVLGLVNDARADYDVASLAVHPALAYAARVRSITMATAQKLSHTGWLETIYAAGYPGGLLGENIAYGYGSPSSVMSAWLASAGHRANILRPAYRYIGIGCVIDSKGRRWWTQDFAG